jgi:hypothetical protein
VALDQNDVWGTFGGMVGEVVIALRISDGTDLPALLVAGN